MAVVSANLHILCMLIGTAATVQVQTIKQLVEMPMNRLEGKTQSCVDVLERRIPLNVSSCDSYFALPSMRERLLTTNFEMSKQDFSQTLPSRLRTPMEQRIKDFDKKYEHACSDASFYCQFQLRDVMFLSGKASSFVGVCAPCGNDTSMTNRLLQIPGKEFYLPMEGSADFKVKLKGDKVLWKVEYDADELVLASTGNSNSSGMPKHPRFGVRLRLKGKLEGDQILMTLSCSTFEIERNATARETEVYVEREPPQVTVVNYFEDSDPFPIVWVFRQATKTLFEYQQNQLVLSKLAGGYFTYCNYTLIVKRTDHGWTSLCGRIYFMNGSSIAELEKISAAQIVNHFDPESAADNCTMQMIKVITAEGATKNDSSFLDQHVTMILCMCNASMSDKTCDQKFKQHHLDKETMDKIKKTQCLLLTQDQINVTVDTGYYTYCVYIVEDVFWGLETAKKDEPCYGMRDKPVGIEILNDACFACCLATPNSPCNAEFQEGGKYRNLFNECLHKLHFGPPNVHSPEIVEFPQTLPYAERVFFPHADLIDVNKEFDKLMGVFHMNFENMSITSVATFNPVGHAYFERTNSSYRISSTAMAHNRKMRNFCSLSNWGITELSMGCKCFTMDETELQCCCLKRVLLHAASLMSVQFPNTIHGVPIDQLHNSRGYRESLAVNKDVFIE
ncbi:unnamed protein product [Bursaphelenchus xylophilus]|uniref:(pine wood nematode) hypothetical protein n=1 Tax=Bursaphelenchus xylophilus TaxID=6326 RepID=A0A1I7RQN1_BURXY|nr:unnamed protein product [Bursaphelenchus xylophilus]CAG9104849.1 unnamed protein product [Bursaphelenchus xylophilus]